MRVGGSTQIQVVALKNDVTDVDVASGVARFYNRSSDGVVRATTPFGAVVAERGAVFDLYVGDDSMEAIAIKGVVQFVHETDKKRYEVQANASSIVADAQTVEAGDRQIDAEWDDWNAGRDQLWQKRVAGQGESVKNLPPALQHDAYALAENGQWATVEYEGAPRRLWRPRVNAEWSPFTVGRWTEYYGDQCWMPREPFGYVTHHYGNWVNVRNAWYWAPPVVARPAVRAPALDIRFGWNPGRVAWVHSGGNVGWVPLAPTEPYHTVHRWGPHATVVSNVATVKLNLNTFRFVDRAIVVPQTRFYSVNDYRSARVTNINRTTLINTFRPAPVVNNTVITNYTTIKQRYVYNTDVRVERRPHQVVEQRIVRIRDASRQTAPRENAREITQNIRQANTGTVENRPARLPRPTVTTKLVNPDEVSKPREQVQFQQRQVKERERPAQESPTVKLPEPEPRRGTREQQEEPRGVRPERPGAPGQEQPQAEEGERGKPGRPGKVEQEAQPEKSRQPARTQRRPEGEQQQQQKEQQQGQQGEQQRPQQGTQQRRQQREQPQQGQQGEQQRPQQGAQQRRQQEEQQQQQGTQQRQQQEEQQQRQQQ